MAPRLGRRPGNQATRQSILAAARQTFAERGFDGATIREIAAGAGVDPALVHHYFGTKEQLFLAVLAPPFDPDAVLAHVFAAGREQLAERLVRTFLSVWDGPMSGPAMRSLVRGAVSDRRTGQLAREFFATQVVRRLIARLGTAGGPDEIRLRASLIASQLFGLALVRYILRLEPLASADGETVVAALTPTIDRYLTGDLGRADGTAG